MPTVFPNEMLSTNVADSAKGFSYPEEFARHLYEITEHCDFGFNTEECLRDRIVIRMADKELSERL